MTQPSFIKNVMISSFLAFSFIAVPTLAQQNNQGGPNENCPDGTELVAKFEWNGSEYVFEKPEEYEGVVTILAGADENGGDWTAERIINVIIVKGGTSTHSSFPAADSGSFSNEGLENNPSGNPPDISNLQFCADPSGDDSGNLVEDLNMSLDEQGQLSWSTASEVDNGAFNIWKLEGSVPSKSVGYSGADYSQAEVTPAAQPAYVIQAIDLNGKNTFHVLGDDGKTYTYKLVRVE